MSFDPDAYLAQPAAKPFDPDAWLKANGEPTSNYVADKARRLSRDAIKGIGQLVAFPGTAFQSIAQVDADLDDWLARKLPGGPTDAEIAAQRAKMDAVMQLQAPMQAAQALRDVGADVGKAFPQIGPADPARDSEVGSAVASGAGSLVPLLATGGMGTAAQILAGAGLMGEQQREDAERSGATPSQQAVSFGLGGATGLASEALLGLPAMLRSVRGAKIVPQAMASAEAGVDKLVASQLGNLGQMVPMLAKAAPTFVPIVQQAVKTAAREGVQEGIEQIAQNTIAKDAVGYDPTRDRTEGLGMAMLAGGIVGGGLGAGTQALAGLDTRKNVAETTATLAAQQEQLLAGRRAAQMFPVDAEGNVTNELPLPEGMQRVETERGVFHYNPEQITADEIFSASAKGAENRALNLGSTSKPEAEAAAAQNNEALVTITERTPDGTEVRSAVINQSAAARTQAEMQPGLTPGNTLVVETPEQTLAGRAPDFLADILNRDAQALAARQAADAKEKTAREQRQRDLDAKKENVGEAMQQGDAVLQDSAATFADVQGALQRVQFYAENNALGITQDQRIAAQRQQAKLAQRLAALEPAELARRDLENQKRLADDAAALAAQKAQRTQAKQEFKQEVTAGRDATGAIDYTRMAEDDLVTRAQAGDARAEKILMQRADSAGDDRPTLLDVLARVKLPGTDTALGGELKLLAESMTVQQRRQLIATKETNLDAVAETLRADHGFSQIQTPADVIDFVERALRGEDIRPDRTGEGQVEFASGKLTREEFLGTPKITSNANAADLRPIELLSLRNKPTQPFLNGNYTAKFDQSGASVFDGDRLIASYNFGRTLVVDPKYRRQGIASELIYQWRTQFPTAATTEARTATAQRIQEKVWQRIDGENNAQPDRTGEGQVEFATNKAATPASPADPAPRTDFRDAEEQRAYLRNPDNFNDRPYPGVVEGTPLWNANQALAEKSLELDTERRRRKLSFDEIETIAQRATGRSWPDFQDVADYDRTLAELRNPGSQVGKFPGGQTEIEFATTQDTFDLGGTPVGIDLPNQVRNLAPRWQEKTLAFESSLDKALYYAGGTNSETRDLVANRLAQQTGLTTGQIATLARQLRDRIAPLTRSAAQAGTIRVPAQMRSEVSAITGIDFATAATEGSAADETRGQISETAPAGPQRQPDLPRSDGDSNRNAPAQKTAQGSPRGTGRGLDPQTSFPAIPATPEALRTRSLPEIEAIIRRGGIDRDRAAAALRAYDLRLTQAREAKGAEFTARPSPIPDEATAERLATAIKKFDAGGKFVWPAGTERLKNTTMYAAGSAPQIEPTDDATIERELTALVRAFPRLAELFKLRIGSIRQEFDEAAGEAGYKGQIPSNVEAAVWGQKRLIVVAARAWRDRNNGAALLTHEVAHLFWDTLPTNAKDQLRALYAKETGTKTGPLYDAQGFMRGSIQFERDRLPVARVAADPDLPVKEWFAERIAIINKTWAEGRLDRTETPLLRRIADELRQFLRRIVEAFAARSNIDPDSELFEAQFRAFILAGADVQIGRNAGTSYAQKKAQFATRPDFATGERPAVPAWPENFPNVVVMTTVPNLYAQGGYQAAKAGNAKAALDVVLTAARENKFFDLQKRFPNAILVPVRALERAGNNRLPGEFAAYFGHVTGLRVNDGIVQNNQTGHTGSGSDYRMAHRPSFDGAVIPGQTYIIVDDVVTMGGTLGELRAHIESRGGKVGAITTLAAAQFSAQIALTPKTKLALETKFDQVALREWLQQNDIYGGEFGALTEAEGRWLLAAKTLDAAGNRLAAQRRQGDAGGIAGEVGNSAPPAGPGVEFATSAEAAAQTATPEFKAWFGDWQDPQAYSTRAKGPVSFVVDWKAGRRPLRVYHSSVGDFNAFESGRPTFDDMGLFGNVETNRHAIFFSDSPEQANSYVENRRGKPYEGAKTYPAYLDIKSPADFTSADPWTLAEEAGVNPRWIQNKQTWELFDGKDGKEFVEGLKKAGYDGAIFTEDAVREGVTPGTTYAVFEPTQIKSATGNRGTFDPADPRIDFATSERPAGPGVEFATGPDSREARLQEIRDELDQLQNSQEDQSEINARGQALTDERDRLQAEQRAEQREQQVENNIIDLRHPAAVATPEPGDAWAMVPKMTDAQLRQERMDVGQHLVDNYQDLGRAGRALLNARIDAIRAEEARRAPQPRRNAEGNALVDPIPKTSRRDALIAELQRGRAMANEANRTGNDEALKEGVRLTRRARETLNDEFPGWETAARPTTAQAPSAAPDATDTQPGPLNATPPPRPPAPPIAQAAQPEDAEPSPFTGENEPKEPIRKGKIAEVYGHSSYQPGVVVRTWRKVRDTFVGIRGPIPELPAFPGSALNAADRFLKEKGPQFYNGLREFYRALKSGNDYIQRMAEEQVARITRPLIEAGGKFSADDYAKLQKEQMNARRLRAEGKIVPAGKLAEITALQSKMEGNPYVLFNRLVLMLDLKWRHENLKDSRGNPIALPSSLNRTEVNAELARLGQTIQAGPHAALIRTALDRHMQLVKDVAADLQSRELIAAEQLANPYYFPHLTLEIKRGDKTEQRELTPTRVRPGTEADFRGYLQDPVGSRKPIETDYVRALYYHLVQVGAHNLKADAIAQHARPYDVMAEVRARAEQLSRTRGESVSWEQAFNEEFEPAGYVRYGTDSRDAFPTIMVDRDKLARRLGRELTSEDLQQQLARLGMDGVRLMSEDLKETLMAGNRETWIVPARVAEALRGIADRETRTTGEIEAAMKWALGKWKGWKLFMPWNHIRYEYGNVVADVEKIFSATPGTFMAMPEAAREIRAFWLGGEPSADLRAALKDGVINAITAQEMGGLVRLRAFKEFETTADKVRNAIKRRGSSALLQPLAAPLGLGDFSSPELSAFREAVFRYANFKHNLGRLRAGERPDYGGAYNRDIDAMQDSKPGAKDRAERQAGQISKATFGDYGDMSVLGQTLRDKLIPFYSWMEVNFKYHANLFRNLRDMVRANEVSKIEAAGKGARAAATFAAGFGARAAGGFVLRLALPYVAVALWNGGLGAVAGAWDEDDEIEKELSEEDRRRFHIILGRNADGTVNIVYGQTALIDIMKWFSGASFMQQAGNYLNGKTDFPTALAEWRDKIVPDFLNNTVGSFGPYAKIPVTLATKKNPFPDVTDMRTVPAYDMRRVIIGQIADDFTADQIERIVSKDYYAARDFGTWAKQLVLQVRQRDPEAWAFYAIKDKAAEFEERMTGNSDDSSRNSEDQQVLRNFRRAIYKGDVEKAVQFYQRLLDYRYTADRFKQNIRNQDPLAGLNKKDGLRAAFVAGLTPDERRLLERAYSYYTKINSQRGEERGLFPSERSGAAGLQRFQTNPQVDRLRQTMENNRQLDDDARQLQAERALQNSLRNTR